MPQIILDTNKGLTIPALTTAQKNAIVSPSTGALVYDTTLGAVSDYNGSSWDVATVLSQFGNSLSGTGYQKLPGGLIIQWTNYFGVTTSGTNWTYPIAFPNAAFSVVGVDTGSGCYSFCATPNTTTCNIFARDVGAGGFANGNGQFIALGW